VPIEAIDAAAGTIVWRDPKTGERFVTPVTGPRPFDYEALVLFNFRFGRSARRAIPPVTSG